MPTPLQMTQSTVGFIGSPTAPDGTLTPEQIVNAVGTQWPKGHCKASTLDAATTGNLPPYTEPSCGGTVSGSSLNINGALAAAGARAGAIEVSKKFLKSVPVVGEILDSVAGLIALPFQHHAQAVKIEQANLCRAVPWAFQLLQGVDEFYLTGQIDARTASAALDNGLQQFLQMVKSIYQDGGGKLNAAGCYARYLKAAILYRKNIYLSAVSLSTRGSNDVFLAPAKPSVPPGSTGQFAPLNSNQNAATRAVAPASFTQSLLGEAGVNSNKLVLAVMVLIILGMGVFVNASILRRVK